MSLLALNAESAYALSSILNCVKYEIISRIACHPDNDPVPDKINTPNKGIGL